MEKEAKLAAKLAKQTAVAAATAVTGGEKKVKEKKEKKEAEAAFVNTTPKGEKKGAPIRHGVVVILLLKCVRGYE